MRTAIAASAISGNAVNVHNSVLLMVRYGATLDEIRDAVQSALDDPVGSYEGPPVLVTIKEVEDD